MAEGASQKQLEELLAKLEKWHATGAALLADVKAVLEATPTSGQQVKRLFKTWSEVWGTKYRDKYTYGNNAAIAAGFGRLLKALEVEEIERRMLAFLQSRERFYVDARHPVEMFIKAVNKFGVEDDGDTFLHAPPIGCRHKPMCAHEQAHTQREQRELRMVK